MTDKTSEKKTYVYEDGIWPPFEAFYIESMFWHTASAKRSIEIVGVWLELIEKDDKQALELPKSELFEQLQNILHQAGCISRYFFPSRTQRTQPAIHFQRSQRLKQAFVIEDNNPLKERGLRDAIEHFDERLDKYLVENQVGEYLIEGDVGYVPRQSEVPLHIFKGFYIQPLIFVLLGTSYEMEPIVNEMLRIHEALQACMDKGYRLP